MGSEPGTSQVVGQAVWSIAPENSKASGFIQRWLVHHPPAHVLQQATEACMDCHRSNTRKLSKRQQSTQSLLHVCGEARPPCTNTTYSLAWEGYCDVFCRILS